MLTIRRTAAVPGLRVARFVVVGLVALFVAAVSPVLAQVLDQVPSDSLVVLKINHLQDTSTKLAGLMQALGVTDFVPTLADPLAAAMSETGATGGIDKAGDAAVALLDFNWDRPPRTPPILIVLPVSDYKAFLAGTTVVNTTGEVSTVKFKNDNQPMYVVNRGAFALMSPSADVLAKKMTGTVKPAGLAARQMAENDATIFVNFPVLKAKALPKLRDGREKLLAEVDRAFSRQGGDAKKSPLLKAVVNQALNVAQGFLEDAQATTMGFTFGKNGINGTLLSEFTASSYSSNLVGQFKGNDQSMLKGLPGEKYLFYGGFVNNQAASIKALDDLTAPIMKELGPLGDVGKTIEGAINSYRESLQYSERGSFGMVAPNPQAAGGLVELVAVYKGDAEKLKAAGVTQAKAQEDVMKALGLPSAQMQKTTHTPSAKSVSGVSFDQVKIDFNFAGNTPQEMQAQQAINFLYGPNGFTMLSGVVDPKTLLIVGGGNDQLLSTSIAAAKSDTDALGMTDPVKTVDAELPKSRIGVFYIPLDTIASTAVGYAGKMGFAVPVQIPPNLPPIGMTFGTDGNAVRIDGHIPTPLVQSLVQAVMQVFVQMRGGGPGGGGGGAGGL